MSDQRTAEDAALSRLLHEKTCGDGTKCEWVPGAMPCAPLPDTDAVFETGMEDTVRSVLVDFAEWLSNQAELDVDTPDHAVDRFLIAAVTP